jgi:glycerol uptake facilitator-like aquaporin
MHVGGGYLNPAITIMLWVFKRMETVRAAWLIGAQLLGAVLAGAVLRNTFDDRVLQDARLGTPHLNRLVYGDVLDWAQLRSGCVIEFILTFFLVFAIFGTIRSKAHWRQLAEGSSTADDPEEPERTVDARLAALIAGGTLTACVLFAYPLTGAATNPARWFGPAFWEGFVPQAPGAPGAWADMLVYIAGPILGALAAGLVFFMLLPLTPAEKAAQREEKTRRRSLEPHVTQKK